jgi:hypothetical protein
MKIQVKIASKYGKELIYPCDPAAHLFAEIAGTTTLTRAVIEHIKALGYTVEVIPETPASL